MSLFAIIGYEDLGITNTVLDEEAPTYCVLEQQHPEGPWYSYHQVFATRKTIEEARAIYSHTLCTFPGVLMQIVEASPITDET